MAITKLAILCQLINALWAANVGTSKELLANVQVANIELNLIVNVAMVFAMTIFACAKGVHMLCDIPSASIPTLVIGGIAYQVTLIFTNLMVLALPLAINDVFWALSPLVTALLGRLVLSEKINTPTCVAMLLSFGTVLMLSHFQRHEK